MLSTEPWPSAPGVPAPTGPLAGLRVLDLSRVLSGPFATMTLADLGADVIKVEAPGIGDDTRAWAPPYHGPESAYFLSANRNKRSVAVDLKSEDGRRLAQRLAAAADVLVENFRPGTAEKLGLGYEAVDAANPGIVYCSVSGYGQTGPERDRPGYDAIAQARSGMMSITGCPDGPPVRTGVASADLSAGMWATIGVLAALHERARSGQGQWVDIALLDAQVSWLTYVASGYLATGEQPKRFGSAHPTIVPYQAFATADDDLMITVGNDRLWRAFTDATGLHTLADDPRFATNPDRVAHRDVLLPLIADRLLEHGAGYWCSRLAAVGVPVTPVASVPDVLTDPQLIARDMFWTIEHPTAESVTTTGCPVHLSRTPTSLRRPPPVLGEHTAEITAW